MKKPLMIILLITTLTIISGCATSPYGTATSGGANYSYSKTAAGDCTVTINSAREIAGASLTITDQCKVTVTADSANGAAAMNVINSLIGKIP